jgi:hypothetical protein
MKKILAILILSASAFGQAPQLPNSKLTPGVTSQATAKELCAKTFTTADVRLVTDAMKNEVYSRYGIKPNQGYCKGAPYKTKAGKTIVQFCEVDHLISLELGGANDVKNLWPQSYPSCPGAHQKDQLENTLNKLVCAGKITLEQAQKEISTDWIKSYKSHVGPMPCKK